MAPSAGPSAELAATCQRYRQAVELAPDDPTARNNLAVILCVAGEYAEALLHAQRTVELQPALAAPYVNGAVIAGLLNGHAAALPWLDAALRVEPNYVPALLLCANTLAKLDRAEEALALCQRATALAPDNGEVYELAATALQAARRYDEALAAFAKAQTLSSAGTIGVRKAMLLTECGRRDEALVTLDGVLAIQPNLAVAWYARAIATEFQLSDREIVRMERILASVPNLTFNDRIQLEFAIGRTYLTRGRLKKAFAHLGAGNAMKRSSIPYDIEADERWIDDIPKQFTAECLEGLRANGYRSDLPVFVVGMPRSGTTLIEQILASHPSIFGAGELRYVSESAQAAGMPEPQLLEQMGRAYVAKVTPLDTRARRIVDKAPLNFLHAGLINLMLPQARIIHVRRDSMDTCFSCYTTLFDQQLAFTYDLTELGRFHRAYERLMDHWRMVLPPDRFIELAYEDVVADLETQARRLVEFCGLPWNAQCLDFHKTERPVHTASMNQVRRPIFRTSVGRAQGHASYLAPLIEALSDR